MRIIKNRALPIDQDNAGNSVNVADAGAPQISQPFFPTPENSNTQANESSGEKVLNGDTQSSKKRNRDGSPVHKRRSSAEPEIPGEGYNSEDEHFHFRRSPTIDDEVLKNINPATLYRSLKKKGFQVVETAPDGNCLFRAVADQVFGDMEMHGEIRRLCMNYMEKERDHFSQFVTEDFPEYLARKRRDGVFGNHLELQAIAELYNRPVYIYTIDESMFIPHSWMYDASNNPPLHLSYHFGNHYNSVRDPDSPAIGVGLGLPGPDAAAFNKAEKAMLKQIINKSEESLLEEELIRNALEQSELEILEKQLSSHYDFSLEDPKAKHPRYSPPSEQINFSSSSTFNRSSGMYTDDLTLEKPKSPNSPNSESERSLRMPKSPKK